MVKKLQKIYLTYYNLSVALDIVCLVTKIINTKFDEKLKERFLNTHKLSNHGNSKFILLLQKGVYLYEYMDDSEKFNQTSLPEIEDFYGHFYIEDITDAYYTYPKRVCQDFEIKNLGERNDLCVQSNALLLADVFENLRNRYLKIDELHPAKFPSAPEGAWQAALRKT